jgi:hypothetical protein
LVEHFRQFFRSLFQQCIKGKLQNRLPQGVDA